MSSENTGLDPASVVLRQDELYTENGIDIAEWARTVQLPLTLFSGGRCVVLKDSAALADHLKALERLGFEAGIAKLQTTILSHLETEYGVSIIGSIRQRLATDGTLLASTSITWRIVLEGDVWKINQIHFNDSVVNPSVVSQVLQEGS